MTSKKDSTRAKKQAKRAAHTVHRADASMIISRLASIEDPMLSYLLGMVIDRVAQLVASKREALPEGDSSQLSKLTVT